MGQRLNIEIRREGEVLANAYYHWSAYTYSALELTQTVISAIDEVKESDPIIEAVRLLEATGAGLSPDEKERVNEIRDTSIFKDCINRNEGLIAITPKGIEMTRLWEEGRVVVNLDTETIQFDVCYEDELDNYEDDEEEYEKMKKRFDSYSTYDQDIREFTFEEIGEITNFVGELLDYRDYGYKLEDGTIIVFID